MTLSAKGIRIIAPIPGKGTIGIEVPNHDAQTVSIHSILSSKAFQETEYELPMAMGATISNDVYIADLAAMPHILVAGATGQGKSVGLNTIIASLLYKKHPAELKFVLIDPKRVEFSLYNALERHFLAKLPDEEEAIVTNMDNVVKTLNSLCVEMERRYDLLKDAHVVKITKYNELFIQKKLNPEKGHRYLPYIVIIVDEFADLIMVAGKQVETPIRPNRPDGACGRYAYDYRDPATLDQCHNRPYQGELPRTSGVQGFPDGRLQDHSRPPGSKPVDRPGRYAVLSQRLD